MKCPNCDTENEVKAAYCSTCGMPFSVSEGAAHIEDSEGDLSSKRKKSRRGTFNTILASVFAVAVVAGSTALYFTTFRPASATSSQEEAAMMPVENPEGEDSGNSEIIEYNDTMKPLLGKYYLTATGVDGVLALYEEEDLISEVSITLEEGGKGVYTAGDFKTPIIWESYLPMSTLVRVYSEEGYNFFGGNGTNQTNIYVDEGIMYIAFFVEEGTHDYQELYARDDADLSGIDFVPWDELRKMYQS